MRIPLVLTLSAVIAASLFGQGAEKKGPVPKRLTLIFPSFTDGGTYPVKYSIYAPNIGKGDAISPEMHWTNVPPGTMSFFLNMHDMEGVRNKTSEDQAHWVVWNIPGTATGIPEGVPKGSQLPDGSYQISASGPVYRGPGARAADTPHHYMFELYALDTKLDVTPAADAFETRTNVMKAIQGHILGKAVYVGFFKEPQP
jgi:hypothetical protein